jgi:nucleotide-binding universal stress UspA family protein
MDRPYSRIACCIDSDGMAENVLREGIRLAGGALGSLRIVHVLAPPRTLMAGPFAYVPALGETRGEAQAWLEEATREIAEATPVLLEGFPPREVCSWARSCGVDLIVAAAHRGLVERAMLGGFAYYIAYHAPCPVLLVHRPTDRPATAGATAGAAGERS